MSLKRSLNLGRACDGEEDRLRRCRVMKKKKESRAAEKLELELEEEEANKSLYICCLEHGSDWVAYVIRTIKLGDLLSSSSSEPLRLQQVAYKTGDDLPGSVGCGVMGSQIVFAGGLTPTSLLGLGVINSKSVWHRHVYAFETGGGSMIRKLDATLQQGKLYPLTVELGGKLYALSYRLVTDPPSFEVFDPKMGTWSALPQPPFFQVGSPYYEHAPFSYAIAGTKMFVSHQECPVFCFDVAHPNREWRLVPTMCQGGPFPFLRKSLVLDLPPDDNNKLMFAYTHERWRLRVYLMSLNENQESITQIGDLSLPELPYEFGFPSACDFVHIGGHKACLVASQLGPPFGNENRYDLGTHKVQGVAMPFQYEYDITKVDKKSCFTLQFMPTRIFEFHTNPPTTAFAETVGCFVL